MLDFSSGSAHVNTHGRNPHFLAPASVLESSTYAHGRTSNFSGPTGVIDPSISRSSVNDQTLDSLVESPDQSAWPQLGHRGNEVEFKSTRYHNPESDLSLQLSATRAFLLGPEYPSESTSPVPQVSLVQMQNTRETGPHICESHSGLSKFRKQDSLDWIAAIDLDVPSSTMSTEFSTLWFDEGQFAIPSRDDSDLTLPVKRRFSISEISPEWAFCFESTKVIF